jgi:hypothetical protein
MNIRLALCAAVIVLAFARLALADGPFFPPDPYDDSICGPDPCACLVR